MGFDTASTFDEAVFGGLLIGRFAILGSKSSTGLNTIDLVRPRSDRYARLAISRAPEAPLRGRTVKVLTPEDFIIFKVLSTRDRDVEDAAGVLRRSRDLVDLEGIRREIETLAEEIAGISPRDRLDEVLRRSGEGRSTPH
ncbi:MAG: nucleotidyltransferase [Candidatus Eisenbacteria bacterium]|nr:nucleotidyltransferase [Candidatus Eisenbacteria bacterium]